MPDPRAGYGWNEKISSATYAPLAMRSIAQIAEGRDQMSARRDQVEELLSSAEAAFRLAIRDLDSKREASMAGGTRNAYKHASEIVHQRMHAFLAEQRKAIEGEEN